MAGSVNFLLCEDEGYVLQEHGGRIIIDMLAWLAEVTTSVKETTFIQTVARLVTEILDHITLWEEDV